MILASGGLAYTGDSRANPKCWWDLNLLNVVH